MALSSNEKRARLRLIRRTHRKREGLPVRRDFGRARREDADGDPREPRDLDTTNPELLGYTEDL